MRYVVISLLIILGLTSCLKNQNKHQLGKPWTEIEGNSKVGIEKKYSAEGVLIEETPFVNAIPHGIKKEYYSDGKLHRITPCDSGIVNGVVIQYYKSGKVYRETPFVKGRIDGVIRKYHDNGKVMSELTYKENEAQLGLVEYDEKGNLIEQPKLLIKGRDKTILDGSYVIELTLSNGASRVNYSLVIDGGTTEYLSPIVSEKGKGVYTEYIPKGDLVMKKLLFEAKYNTKYGNLYKVRSSFALAVSNN